MDVDFSIKVCQNVSVAVLEDYASGNAEPFASSIDIMVQRSFRH